MANAKRVNMEMQNSANTADVENVVAKISIGTQPVEKAEKLSVGVATKSTRSQTKPQKTITEFSEDLERHYQFYRALVKNNIFNMTSVTGKQLLVIYCTTMRIRWWKGNGRKRHFINFKEK